MKLRHTASFALMIATLAMSGCQKGCQGPGQSEGPLPIVKRYRSTFYLMAPPHATRNGQTLVGTDLKAPFSRWQKKSMYTTAEDCEQAKAADVRDGHRILNEAPKDPSNSVRTAENARWASGYEMANEQCVGENDPRLKKN